MRSYSKTPICLCSNAYVSKYAPNQDLNASTHCKSPMFTSAFIDTGNRLYMGHALVASFGPDFDFTSTPSLKEIRLLGVRFSTIECVETKRAYLFGLKVV